MVDMLLLVIRRGRRKTKMSTRTASRKQPNRKQSGFWGRHRRLGKWLLGIGAGVVMVAIATWVAFQVSPWPNSLLLRYEMGKMGAKQAKSLESYAPPNVISIENQQYRANDKDGYLDVFYPEKTDKALPTVIWVHGGAWISGDKNDIDGYLKILAARGYTTVGVDYTIAPEAQYPHPLTQVNDALSYLQGNAERLHIDTNKIVLAGDSAGSQIIAQMTTLITSSSYANEVGIQPTLAADKLRAVLLNCGAYDLTLPDYNGPFGKFLHTVLWAYSGKKDFLSDPRLKQASVINYVTKEFPPTFITAGNADPLESQSLEMARKLDSLGVQTSTLFYPDNHTPQLVHEYQFELDISDARKALDQMTGFLKEYTQ